MNEKQYDVTVIGSGPGGYVSAIRATQNGKKTCLIERDKLGGVCLNWGCIPSKALLKSAELYNAFKKSADFGINHKELSFDFQKIISRSRQVAERVSKGVGYLMKKNNIDVVYGNAHIASNNQVKVTKEDSSVDLINSKNIVIATGAKPRSIPNVQIDHSKIITSKDAMQLTDQPKSMIVIGGGAIGIEFAYFYNSFGTKVTVVEMLPSILPYEDKEITKMLESSLRKQGVDILTNSKVEEIKIENDGTTAIVSMEKERINIKADIILMAVGVQANIEDIGLEAAGIEIKNGFIAVNEQMQTSIENIYAVGDVTGPPLLAHLASYEGIIAADHIAGKPNKAIDKTKIPSCTYCNPQIASIGLTEDSAILLGYEIKIGRFPYRPLGKAIAIGENEGLVKLIFNKKDGKLIGAHIFGAEATEMIAELSLARNFEATWQDIHNTIHAHPTLSEAIMEAAGKAYGTAINI